MCTPSRPQPTAAIRPPQLLSGVQIVGQSHVWVVGSRRILATADGGLHWTNQYKGNDDFTAVDFVDGLHGWAVASEALFGTVDGRTWRQLGEPHFAPLTSVHFVSPALGWGIATTAVTCSDGGQGELGQLVHTTDGGQTWAQATPGKAQSVCFVDGQQGWITTAEGRVLRTFDGGAGWNDVFHLDPPIRAPATPGTAIVECAGPHAAWVYFAPGGAALGHSPYIAFQATDGATFHPVLKEEYTGGVYPDGPQGPGSYPGPFSVVSPTVAQFLGFDPSAGYGQVSIMAATEEGRTLGKAIALPNVSSATAVSFATQNLGWVVGGSIAPPQSVSYILRTADGGLSWQVQLKVTS